MPILGDCGSLPRFGDPDELLVFTTEQSSVVGIAHAV